MLKKLPFSKLRYFSNISYDNLKFSNLISEIKNNKLKNYKKEELIKLAEKLKHKEQDLIELNKLKGLSEYTELAIYDYNECLKQIKTIQSDITDQLINQNISVGSVIENEYFDFELSKDGIELEITSGVGGQESSLFAMNLFDLYQRYSTWLGLDFYIINSGKTESGGLRKTLAEIRGDTLLVQNFKYECGVHRVQRVPKTERHGRVHTSTVAVALLPIFKQKNLDILTKDLQIDTFKSQGKGGQHVNATDSAVRISHLPTGLVVECQEERSQIANRNKAMQILMQKIAQTKQSNETTLYENTRKIHRGSLSRSEKIRTYNFPQDRITDHRLSSSSKFESNFYGLRKIFEDNSSIASFHSIISKIDEHFKMLRVQQILSQF